MSAVKLLPCPFCGSEDVENGRTNARYHCYLCGADGPQIPYAPDDKFWTWNTRATQTDPRDEVIAKLVEALKRYKSGARRVPFDLALSSDAALAAAKEVQP